MSDTMMPSCRGGLGDFTCWEELQLVVAQPQMSEGADTADVRTEEAEAVIAHVQGLQPDQGPDGCNTQQHGGHLVTISSPVCANAAVPSGSTTMLLEGRYLKWRRTHQA